MYIVIIEWDGEKPPNTFYHRMHKMGLYVRGDKELSPLKRRANAEGAVVAQEGAVLCSSESLARVVAAKALECGAKVVKIGTSEPVDYYVTLEDKVIIERIESIYGKVGRPSGERVDWAVTCYEECASYPAYNEYGVVNCPFCSGANIIARVGEVDRWKLPEGDIFEAWLRTRFAHGEFEVPHSGDRLPPRKVEHTHALEKAYVDILRKNTELRTAVGKLPRETACKVLDGILAARCYRSYDRRLEMRVDACTYLFQHNVSPLAVSMTESNNEVDFLDAAATVGSTTTAQLWMSIYGKGDSHENNR